MTDSPADFGAVGGGRVPGLAPFSTSYLCTISEMDDRLSERFARASAAGGDSVEDGGTGEMIAVAGVVVRLADGDFAVAPMSMD